MKEHVLISIAIISILIGCTMPDPNLTRRYKTHEFQPPTGLPDEKAVDFSIFTLPVETLPQFKTVFDLSAQGQAAFIKAVAGKIKDHKEFLAALSSPIEKQKSAPKVDNSRTLFKRRIIFSVRNKSLEPSDRIRWIRITMKLDKDMQELVQFKSWDKFKSEYDEINLGKLIFVQGNTFGFELGAQLPIGPAALSPKASSEFTRNVTEEIGLKQKYIIFSGPLQKDKALFTREGVVGIDLTGESVVDIEMKTQHIPVWVATMTDLTVNNKPNTQENVKIGLTKVLIPKEARAIYVDVEFDYILRHVTEGKETIVEGDDNVMDIYGKVELKNVELVLKEDMEYYAWSIQDPKTNQSLHLEPIIGPRAGIIEFDSYDKAREFLNWLKKTNATKIDGLNLYVGTCEPPTLRCVSPATEDIKNFEIRFKLLNAAKNGEHEAPT